MQLLQEGEVFHYCLVGCLRQEPPGLPADSLPPEVREMARAGRSLYVVKGEDTEPAARRLAARVLQTALNKFRSVVLLVFEREDDGHTLRLLQATVYTVIWPGHLWDGAYVVGDVHVVGREVEVPDGDWSIDEAHVFEDDESKVYPLLEYGRIVVMLLLCHLFRMQRGWAHGGEATALIAGVARRLVDELLLWPEPRDDVAYVAGWFDEVYAEWREALGPLRHDYYDFADNDVSRLILADLSVAAGESFLEKRKSVVEKWRAEADAVIASAVRDALLLRHGGGAAAQRHVGRLVQHLLF